MRQFFTPSDAPQWLQAILNSIRDALSDVWNTALRLKDYATADLPPAADWKQGLVYDSTLDVPKFSNGSIWYELLTFLTGMGTVANRTALAAISASAGMTRFLRENGRQGTFVFDASDLSAFVTADTAQGIYVAPASDTDGSSGAWVRQFTGPMDIRWFGAVADCTAVGVGTDSAAAFNAAKATGLLRAKSSTILVPRAILGYRVASTLTFTSGVKLSGEGFHENPGNVGGTPYSPPQNYRGSMLVFDQNIAGLQFFDFTDNNADAQAFEYEGARFSVVEDLMLYGGAGDTVTAHGAEIRTVAEWRNVRVENFAGNGIKIIANTAGAVPYGNSSKSLFSHVKLRLNGCHGAHVSGIDASVIDWIGCDFASNGGAGYFDATSVGGNNLFGCHFASNNQSHGDGSNQTTQVQADSALLATAANGSIILTNAANTPHVFAGCYVEVGNGSKAHLPAGTVVVGGLLGQVGSAFLTATSAAAIVDGAGILKMESLQTYGGTFTINSSNLAITRTSSLALLAMSPGSSTFSQIQMKGTGGLLANGLDILAGSAVAYFSADTLNFRNAATSVTYGTFSSTGLSVTGALSVTDAGTTRTNLGLGTAALKNTGTSGDAVPVLNGTRTTWAAGGDFGTYLLVDNAGTSLGAAGKAYLGTSSGGAWVNTPTSTNGWLGIANGGIMNWGSNGVDLASGKTYSVAGTRIANARKTGWTVCTGTAQRSGYATYTSPDISATYTEAEVQAIADGLQAVSRTVKALIDDLHSTAGHGLIGT